MFSEDEDLMKLYLEDPPDWLSNNGDTDSQREYLESKVQVQVYERFDFTIHDEFEGVLFQ